jgi:hypothetical protein
MSLSLGNTRTYLMLVQVSRNWWLYRLCSNEWVLPDDGNRIQSPKRWVLNKSRAMFSIKTGQWIMFRNMIVIVYLYA